MRFSICQRTARDNTTFPGRGLLHQVFHVVAVRDAGDFLLDDRAVVQHFGDVVAGGANQLHATGKGAVIGLGAVKGGRKE